MAALSALAGYGSSDNSDEEPSTTPVTSSKASDQPLRELVETKRVKQHPNNQKGIVQISLPRYNNSDDISDEDEDIPKKSVMKISGGISRLTSFLPQPKRSKRSNTSLVPPSIKKPKKAALPVHKHHPNDEDDSIDDDGVTSNFFSNLDTPRQPLIPSDDPLPSISKPPSLPLPNIPVPPTSLTSHTTPQSSGYDSIVNSTYATPTSTYHHGNHEQYGGNFAGQSSSGYEIQEQHMTSGDQQPPTDISGKDELTLDEATFHRLAGSKRGRHKGIEEESLLNIKDVSQDDIKDAVAYKKHLTEGHSHTSGTVPEDLAFSSTQKRKHQIHWLAAQAKAKEQELKNFWSQAATTRRQTQMKYGF